MDKYCQHQKVYNGGGQNEYYFFTWSIPDVSMINNLKISTVEFAMTNGFTYYATLSGSEDKIEFCIGSKTKRLKGFASMIICNKTLLLSNSLNASSRYCKPWYYYDFIMLTSKDESFQKLKQNPNNTLSFTCKIIYTAYPSSGSMKTTSTVSKDILYNLRSLAAVLRNSSESSLKEKVLLQVGEETETVIKAVLCARSPVFAKMFENDMREGKENVVTITDIKMPVLKVLVSYLYTGRLPDCDFDMLCSLYYATDKYDVADLRLTCVDLLISKISMKNIYQVMKLAFSHNDELLKSTALALIATNIETWFSSNDWKNLLNEQPMVAAEVLNFFNF